jgi:hypothetical protein
MHITTKDKLVAWINAAQNSFVLGMAALFLFEQEAVWPFLEDAKVGFCPPGAPTDPEHASYLIPVHYVRVALQDSRLRDGLLSDFREYLLRNTLAEALEHTREYCHATDQEQLLLAQPWYNFARVIRNAMTHDGVIRFDKKRSPPPITFDRWRFESTHEGKLLHEANVVASTATIPVLEAVASFIESLK